MKIEEQEDTIKKYKEAERNLKDRNNELMEALSKAEKVKGIEKNLIEEN